VDGERPHGPFRKHDHLPPLPVVRARRERGGLAPQRRTVRVDQVQVQRVIRVRHTGHGFGLTPGHRQDRLRASLVQHHGLTGASLHLPLAAVVADERLSVPIESRLPGPPGVRPQQVFVRLLDGQYLLDHSAVEILDRRRLGRTSLRDEREVDCEHREQTDQQAAVGGHGRSPALGGMPHVGESLRDSHPVSERLGHVCFTLCRALQQDLRRPPSLGRR
jgi:hypothetical protein